MIGRELFEGLPTSPDELPNCFGICGFPEFGGESDSMFTGNRNFRIAGNEVCDVYVVDPEFGEEKGLVKFGLFFCQLSFFLPVEHPSVGVEETPIENDDVVEVGHTLVDENVQRIRGCPDVIERGCPFDVTDDLGAFLWSPYAEALFPQEFVQLRDTGGFTCRGGTEKFDHERSRYRAVVADLDL